MDKNSILKDSKNSNFGNVAKKVYPPKTFIEDEWDLRDDGLLEDDDVKKEVEDITKSKRREKKSPKN